MFRSKKDLDRHVHDILRKLKNENERNLRCYNIAQLYYKLRDLDSAKHYLSLYLSVKEDSPLAHKLLGQIWEGLGDKVRALNSFKTSLEYQANQPELVLKMCELLCETDVAMDIDQSHYWCERASDQFPHDPAVFRLKEKLLKLGGKANTNAFEELINSEMKARPNDVSVRTRLMRLYLETGRTKAAFNHAVELEESQIFRKELVWYECFSQVCQSYAEEFPSQIDWQLYCSWVSVLDRVASLSMSELSVTKKLVDCVEAVFRMDQVLYKAGMIETPKEQSELYKHFIRHMSAQLCLHISTLILKRAKKEQNNWREAVRAVSAVLILALSPPLDTETPWCLAVKPNLKQSLELWANDGYYRVSQAGYTLLALYKDAGKQFTEKVNHVTTNNNWREKIFQWLFTVIDHRAAMNTSHFVHSEELAKVSVRLPTHDAGILRIRQLVPVYEKARETLHHMVWLGLEITKHNDSKLPVDFHTYSFTRLKLTTQNLTNMSPETLSVLDVDAFLYATVLCADAILKYEIERGFYSDDRPKTLPADITNLLCTQEQMNWWTAASQVNTQQFGNNTNLVVLRQQLQRGLEVVRVNGNYGLDVQLIIKLAQTFADRAESFNDKAGDKIALESRASLYWNAALPLLERMERNQAVSISSSKLFEYPRKELTGTEVSSLLDEGRYFVACQLMKSEQYENAIEAFKTLRRPHASFNQALIYKKLAAAELEERPRKEITSEMRSKHVILLSKARECLKLTWERIRIDRRHPLHQTLPEHLAEVETALSRIEPDPDMDCNIFGPTRSLDLSMQRLGLSFHSSNSNQSEGEANISEPSLSSVVSPAAGDMGLHAHPEPRLNGRTHKHSSTPRRHHNHSEYRRHSNPRELVDVGQLVQIQTLHDEMKKMHEKLELIMESMIEIRRDVNKLKPPVAGDLYVFGEDEEYPDDILGGQYQTTFVPSYPTVPQPTPTFYPTTPRGVQGTSTVTYGAPPPNQQPPVIPLIPMRVPLDPAMAAYQPPQNLAFYNQGALPFTEPQHLPDFLRPNIPKSVLPQQPPPPVNVVITTSDTLPTGPPPIQPTLSVTIPPQHRLGTLPVSDPPSVNTTAMATPPHKFQIAMPPTATIPNFEKSPITIPDEVDSEDDNEIGYDPCPDFRPIIPLPSEVNVTTGEEDDDVLFENRAKLFRFIEKEWKERGVGIVKILKNRATDKVRLLMRRDQVHKVCANHLLKSDMELNMLKNSDRALVWVANDFAEEVVQLEKFCIKFKTPEEALTFQGVFNDAKTKYGQSPIKSKNDNETNPSEGSLKGLEENKQVDSTGKVNLGGFTFTSPPKLKETMDEKAKPPVEYKKDSQTSPSPFAGFTFTTQKPPGGASSIKLKTSTLQESIPNVPLFAGLNSTQNKHSLFDDTSKTEDDALTQSSPGTKDSLFKVHSETSPKTILKQPVLSTVSTASGFNIDNKVRGNSEVAQKEVFTESIGVQPKNIFNFTSRTTLVSSHKETPKSILKEPPASSSIATTPTNTKPCPGAKHVLFQDSTFASPSQETPTLAALLTSPKTPVVDFAALSRMNENTDFQFRSDNKCGGFEGAGSTVFGSSSRGRNNSEGENAEEFVPSAEFKPVVPLPELVEVKTGEEGQEILFNERAKLMRYDSDNREWKERGLGQMKILKDPTTGVARFLMRRDQVLKVCCNHRILPSLELNASTSSEKAWTWYAVDYSEGETKNELFAIRFKTVELAQSFKETVDQVQKQMREEGTSKRSCPDSAPQEEVISTNNVWKCQSCLFPNSMDSRTCKACSKTKSDANSLPKLADLFRPKAGSWECKACYTVNGLKDNTCVSCDSPKEKPKSPGPLTPPVVMEKSAPSLADLFKPKVGSWECGGCLVRNDASKTICPACSTPKPGHEADVKESSTFSCSSFSFGIRPSDEKGTGFSFGIKSSEHSSNNSFTFGIKQEPEKTVETAQPLTLVEAQTELNEHKEPGKNNQASAASLSFNQTSSITTASPFSFSSKPEIVASWADSTTSSVFEAKPPGTTFEFGNLFRDKTTPLKTSFRFGATTPPNISKESSDDFAFGQIGKFEFNFSGVKPPRSPSGSKSPRSPAAGQETDSDPEEVDEEESDHLVFQPIVPLPDKVPLTTGEEDEEVLYCQRAKLYRFTQGEWKERGLGNIKILRHNITQKIRLLMRREPIQKICLNHYLTTNLVFSPKDDRSWLWSAQDFAEGQLTNEQFCLRLKTPEIAETFIKAVDSAQGDLEGAKSQSKNSTVDSEALAETNDVEIVYEAKVTDELRDAALKLQLPPNFYSYLDAAPCPGCIGCEPESEGEEISKSPATRAAVSMVKPSTVDSATVANTLSQPFTFTVKTSTITATTTSSLFNVASPKQTILTTSSTPNLSTTATISSGFTFSLNLPPTTTVSSVGPTTSILGSNSQPESSVQQTSFFRSTPQFQSFAKPALGAISSSSSIPTSKTGSSLMFGTTASVLPATTLSFGSSQNIPPSIFGGSATTQNDKGTPLFDSFSFSSAAKSSPPIFGGVNSQSPANVFGSASTILDQSSPKASPFFSNLTSFKAPEITPLGSNTQPPSMFGTPTTQSGAALHSIFSGNSQSSVGLFGSLNSQTDNSTNTGPTFLFKPTTSFSDIAATNKQPELECDKGNSNFTWTGAGAKVFGGKKETTKYNDEDSGGESGGEEADADTTHDPIFEPIVPLPDAIEVRTGEEEEEKEFCNRAKFYRYDTSSKEWKERGVGDMKILKHRETNTFRLLLRREQVHKVVCNQLITADMDLQHLASSDKSYCWAGMNMAEEYGEPRLEKVAVRFKDSDIAKEFKTKLEECIAIVKTRKENAVAESLNSSGILEPVVTFEEVATDYNEGEEVEDGEYLEGEEFEPMFEKRATLYSRDEGVDWVKISQGDLSVIYNSNINIGHIIFKRDNDEQIVIRVGSNNIVKKINPKEVTWYREHYDQEIEPTELKYYKAEFSSAQAAEEFLATFYEVAELSQTYDSSYIESEPDD